MTLMKKRKEKKKKHSFFCSASGHKLNWTEIYIYSVSEKHHKIRTYKTTTLPSEHSTPNQLQGLTATSSLTQLDKASKGSFTIPCLNFKRALPAHRTPFSALIPLRYTQLTSREYKIPQTKIPIPSSFKEQHKLKFWNNKHNTRRNRTPPGSRKQLDFQFLLIFLLPANVNSGKKSTNQIKFFFNGTKLKGFESKRISLWKYQKMGNC